MARRSRPYGLYLVAVNVPCQHTHHQAWNACFINMHPPGIGPAAGHGMNWGFKPIDLASVHDEVTKPPVSYHGRIVRRILGPFPSFDWASWGFTPGVSPAMSVSYGKAYIGFNQGRRSSQHP